MKSWKESGWCCHEQQSTEETVREEDLHVTTAFFHLDDTVTNCLMTSPCTVLTAHQQAANSRAWHKGLGKSAGRLEESHQFTCKHGKCVMSTRLRDLHFGQIRDANFFYLFKVMSQQYLSRIHQHPQCNVRVISDPSTQSLSPPLFAVHLPQPCARHSTLLCVIS